MQKMAHVRCTNSKTPMEKHDIHDSLKASANKYPLLRCPFCFFCRCPCFVSFFRRKITLSQNLGTKKPWGIPNHHPKSEGWMCLFAPSPQTNNTNAISYFHVLVVRGSRNTQSAIDLDKGGSLSSYTRF